MVAWSTRAIGFSWSAPGRRACSRRWSWRATACAPGWSNASPSRTGRRGRRRCSRRRWRSSHQAGCLDRVLAASVHLRFARVFDAARCRHAQRVGLRRRRLPSGSSSAACPSGAPSRSSPSGSRASAVRSSAGSRWSSLTERDDGVLAALRRRRRTRPLDAAGDRRRRRAQRDAGVDGRAAGGLTRTRARRWSPTCGCAAACRATGRRCACHRRATCSSLPLPGGRWVTFLGDLSPRSEEPDRDPVRARSPRRRPPDPAG